jgi:hypothetical protein
MSACLKEVYTAQRDRMNVEDTDRMDTRVGQKRGVAKEAPCYATTKTRNHNERENEWWQCQRAQSAQEPSWDTCHSIKMASHYSTQSMRRMR